MITPWHWLNVVLCILKDHPRGRFERKFENVGTVHAECCTRCRQPVKYWRELNREASDAGLRPRPASPSPRINGLTSGESFGNELGLR